MYPHRLEKSLGCSTAPVLAAQLDFHSPKSSACRRMVHTHVSSHHHVQTWGCTLTDQDWHALQSAAAPWQSPRPPVWAQATSKGKMSELNTGWARSRLSTAWKKQTREGQRRDWTKQTQDLVILDTEGKSVLSTGLESDETRTWWPRLLSLDEKLKEWKIGLCSSQWGYDEETRERKRWRNGAWKVHLGTRTCAYYCIFSSRVPGKFLPQRDGVCPSTVFLLSKDCEAALETCVILPVLIHRQDVNMRLLPGTIAA